MTLIYTTIFLYMLSGCGLAAQRARMHVQHDRLAQAEQFKVKTRAPIAYEHFEAAQRAADASTRDTEARETHESEARLWLETAIAEAERIALSEQRLEQERALVALDAEIVRLNAARQTLADENALRAAQALAQSEAHNALARAAKRPNERVKLARSDVQRGAEALSMRAELIALSLEALGFSPPALTELHKKLAEAKALRDKDPDASLTRADEALFLAQSLLADARATKPSTDERARAELAEALTSIGAQLDRNDRGLTGRFEASFRQGALTPGTPRNLERLCALAKAHPHGSVQLAVQTARNTPPTTRVRSVRQLFEKPGCRGARYTITASPTEGDAIEASWLAY